MSVNKSTKNKIFKLGLLALICWFGIQFSLFAQQDTLVTKYGDVLVGEIDKVTAETIWIKVKYKGDAISIKLSELQKVSSSVQYVVNDINNKNWKGTLTLDTLYRGELGIRTPDTVVFFTNREVFDVVEDRPRKFTEGLNAAVDFGVNRIKADNSVSANFGFNVSHTTRRWVIHVDYSAFSNVVDTVDNYWSNGVFSVDYVLHKDWFITAKYNLYSSSEQNLDLRRNFLLGAGKKFIHRLDQSLSFTAGVMSNKERYISSENIFNSTESYLSGHYKGKIVTRWEALIDAGLYPSLSESGRVRSNVNLDLKYKFFHHFYIGVKYTLNTDSKPQIEAPKSDYVFALKLGWSLKKF